jgi:hypothetical protein
LIADHAARQFGVDEVAEAARRVTERHQRRDEVVHVQQVAAGLARPHDMAISTPRKPPWKDMPPCQTLKISIGSAKYLAGS